MSMENSPANTRFRFTCGDRISGVHSDVAAFQSGLTRRKSRITGSVYRAAVIVSWLIALTGVCHTALAKDGSFEIRSASSRLYNGVYFANVRVDYRLSNDALEALDSGVELTVQLQIELRRQRRFWLEQDSFATLFSALNNMGRIVDLPIIDAALLDPNANYEIALRAVLDQNTLPGPLRLIAFWSSGFRLTSDWYVWQLSD